MKKQPYEMPEIEVINLSMEGAICDVSDFKGFDKESCWDDEEEEEE